MHQQLAVTSARDIPRAGGAGHELFVAGSRVRFHATRGAAHARARLVARVAQCVVLMPGMRPEQESGEKGRRMKHIYKTNM